MAAYENGIVTDDYHYPAMKERLRHLARRGMYVFLFTTIHNNLTCSV